MIEDQIIGSIKHTTRNLHDLANFLESQGSIAEDDFQFSKFRLREVLSQIKAIQKMVDRKIDTLLCTQL